VCQQVFLNVMRLVTHPFGGPDERPRSQWNIADAVDPDLSLAAQDVENVVGVLMRVLWNFRP
jgi:hypothetical protein